MTRRHFLQSISAGIIGLVAFAKLPARLIPQVIRDLAAVKAIDRECLRWKKDNNHPGFDYGDSSYVEELWLGASLYAAYWRDSHRWSTYGAAFKLGANVVTHDTVAELTFRGKPVFELPINSWHLIIVGHQNWYRRQWDDANAELIDIWRRDIQRVIFDRDVRTRAISVIPASPVEVDA